MVRVQKIKGRKVAVIGFGVEGRDLTGFLLKQGCEVTVLEALSENEVNFSGIDRRRVKLITGKDHLNVDLSQFQTIYRSPGVYRYLPQLVMAEKKGAKISSATNLFFELCPAKIVGVTGTKGKGTTSTLIYKMLKKSGRKVFLAGNIGKPYLELLSELGPRDWIVLELSSFQLIDLKKSPHIAVVLNVTTDHMVWHRGNRSEYINAKRNIVRHQKQTDYAIINGEYKDSRNFAKFTKAKVIFFSKRDLDEKCKQKLLLRGEHNLENIAAAVTVGKLLKIPEKDLQTVVSKFRGLEHRLEYVGTVEGVSFYNDTFATGPQPTLAAVRSFNEPITLILGGAEKGLDYNEMVEEIVKRGSIVCCLLVGEIAAKLWKVLKANEFSGKIVDLGNSTAKKIVNTAFRATPKGGVVLLSPATASFDRYEDYRDFGNQFKEAVENLK